jgi:aminoglycoside phosphotransferase (APT) family kinase protein
MRTSGELDTTPARAWVEGVVGPVTAVRELAGGWTSTMLALTTVRGDQVVLRLMTEEPWRTHGAGLTARESDIQRMLADTAVPAPRTVALDADGRRCGHPAHLMTMLPGRVDVDRVDAASLGELADVLVAVHAVPPDPSVRTYQSWAWEAKYEVPGWASDPGPWREAFDLLRTEPPAYQPCFLHRDFQPRNVLWSGGRISGVVDWVETSLGPAWLDVAHCATNLALVHGNDAAERFATAYTDRTGRAAERYVEVMDVVGFLPPPGKAGFFDDAGPENRRLEDRLRSVLPGTRRSPGRAH